MCVTGTPQCALLSDDASVVASFFSSSCCPVLCLFSFPPRLVHLMLSDWEDRNDHRPGDLSHHQHIARSIGEEF